MIVVGVIVVEDGSCAMASVMPFAGLWHTHTHTRTHTRTHTHTYTHIHIHIHIHTYTRLLRFVRLILRAVQEGSSASDISQVVY